jgi:hypothetical protein
MKIINKRKAEGWVKFDRSLMRDTRVKSNHKAIYLLFCSLSETCENVYPTYAWIAGEVGYKYEGKEEVGSPQYHAAMQAFVAYNLEPIIKLGWIKKINKSGSSCDYEIFDHDCGQESNPQEKSSNPPQKNLRGNPQEKSSTRYNELISYIKKIDTDQNLKNLLVVWIDQRTANKKLPTIQALEISLKKLFKYDLETQIKMVENSVENSWTGIFEIKQQTGKYSPQEQTYQAISQANQKEKQEEAQTYTRTETFEETEEDKRKHELQMQIQKAGVEKIKNELEAGTFDFGKVSPFARITIKNIPDITNKAQAIYGNLLSQGKI